MIKSIHPQIINWHHAKHGSGIDNTPKSESTILQLIQLTDKIIKPLESEFGKVNITYGYTSAELTRFIQKNSPAGTSPSIDQHACHDLNLKNNRITKRDGAACDFFIEQYKDKMDKIALYICNHLPFDKLYYYGNNRPIHVSFNVEPSKHLQVIGTSKNGRRIPGKKAYGNDAINLMKSIINECRTI
ncbi:hypothetical protein [Thalassomonas sp. M1454]|uniref:hypothetical protein n=1 Tax=Thalassomonas sp. M1454 TaxID=2594477 RepID=UPI00117F2FBA|nr:hypothetical protein [Thalassomonas sp. M1454]TRX56699.1 hypothetical protein FNN08_04000 [Thalassomonas sp. M1454]